MAIRNVGSRPPSSPNHIADKEYVDDQVNTKYSKPSGGIPESDMDSNVKSALNRAKNSVSDDDPRLTDSRTPKKHYHDGDDIEFNTVSDGNPVSAFGNTIAGMVFKNEQDISNKADSVHTHTSAQISDATTIGKNLLTSPNQASARSAIGAGTSNLALGTTSSTAKRGDWNPSVDNLTDASPIGKTIAKASSAEAVRTAIEATRVREIETLPANPDEGTLYVTTGDASPVPGLNDKVDAYQGQLLTMWTGNEAAYDALPPAVKSDPGFIAMITKDD